MAAARTVFKKPSIESQHFLSGGSLRNQPLTPSNPDESLLLTEIGNLFNHDETTLEKTPNETEACFPTSKLTNGKLSRRNTFHCQSKEWYKLSPKSKFERKSKKTANLYRHKSDSLLLYEGLCNIKKLPILCRKPSFNNETVLLTPVERVQRQLFTPDSGYSSSSEHIQSTTPHRPRYIIGTFTRAGKLDVVNEIFEKVPELIPKILTYLSEKDLISFVQVSMKWRLVLSHERRDNERKLAYLTKKRIDFQAKKENTHHMVRRSRTLTQSSNPFGDIQETATSERLHALSTSSFRQRTSKHEEFWQAKTTLRDGEMQTKCYCGSPARILSYTSKATCNSCQLDFCTNCKSCYHGNNPCRTSSGTSGSGVLTPKSRRNLRRL